jgi:ribosomal protein S18 acetylase RimI-like enzyme
MSFYSKKMILIERANLEDAPAIVILARYAFLDTYITLAPHYRENIERYVAQAFTLSQTMIDLENSHIQYLVMREGTTEEETIIGYAKLDDQKTTPSISPENMTCIERFYIHPQHKKRGLGSKLMEAVLEEIQFQNKSLAWLSIWEINISVIDFYTKFGFERAGVHPFQMDDKIDEDILMVRKF